MRYSALFLPAAITLPLLACGSDESPAAAPDASPAPQADAMTDHPAPLCDDSQTHLRGTMDQVDIAADLCDFQYALVEHDPWANWTKFEDGLIFLSGDKNIFSAAEPTLEAQSGLLRMPSVTATGGKVYCGSSATYYEAGDDSAPDAEITLDVTGYAGRCGGSGEGTLDLTSTFQGSDQANFAIGGETMQRSVGGAYSDGVEFAFFIEDGFVDVEVSPQLPDEASGESSIISATIALRDGSTRLLLACGNGSGTLKQTYSDLGLEFELHLEGIAPWLDCSKSQPAQGSFTLTRDP